MSFPGAHVVEARRIMRYVAKGATNVTEATNEPVCALCGHAADEHDVDDGKCQHEGCVCTEYGTEDNEEETPGE